MESRFGHDFSSVQVHNDSRASESARAVDALAYTVGPNIVFREGQYRPDTPVGQLLLAHELTHTIQQSAAPFRHHFARSEVMIEPVGSPAENAAETSARQVMGSGLSFSSPGTANLSIMRQAAPPAYGPACSKGPQNPCQLARCDANQNTTIAGDLTLAISYVDAAVSALNKSPIESDTVTALDWYFNSHDKGTAGEVQRRLGCIRGSLADTQANNRYGCHPEYDAWAYTCPGATPICVDAMSDVCVTKQHFKQNSRIRAETLVHECAHRVGMSLGKKRGSVPDIYEFSARFSNLSTDVALQNSDSFALFAGAITDGIKLSVVKVFGASGGTVLAGAGTRTWQGRLYFGAEFQHPVLRIFNPTLGIGLSFIGNPDPGVAGSLPPGPTFLASLVAGVRLADPRPGGAGGPYLSLFGGPALAVGATGKSGVGAEAGVGVGYRWRWLDLSVGAGLVHDPTRDPGRQNLIPITGQLTFIVGQ
jgi:hypothetical protein